MVETQFELTKDEALDLYFKMVLTRNTENKHEELFQKQKVPVYTHLGTGQEAVGCGVSFLLKKDDYLIGTHRGVAEVVGKGMSIKDIFLEYGGRGNSISGGRAGLHLHDPKIGCRCWAAWERTSLLRWEPSSPSATRNATMSWWTTSAKELQSRRTFIRP